MQTVLVGWDNDFIAWVEVNGQRRLPKKDTPILETWKAMQDLGYKRRDNTEDAFVYQKPENLLDDLQLSLEDHDWTYRMSDAFSAYENGEMQVNHMVKLVKEIGAEGKQIVLDYIKKNGGGFSSLYDRVISL